MPTPPPDIDSWDPDAPADGDGLYGLPHSLEQALVRVIPVPFEATVSYGAGTAAAPEAVRVASWQVDVSAGPWREGVAMEPVLADISDWDREAGLAVQRCREGAAEHAAVDALGARLHAHVRDRTAAALAGGFIPGILGGDHSVPVGAVEAAAEAHPGLGLLHIDAHADLRVAYEGFTWSHASALGNMLRFDVGALVSVGLRDLAGAERAAAAADPRITWFEDQELARRQWRGEAWTDTCAAILAPLPEEIWITFDIDGLDPALCPGTGTPVPGGLDWRSTLGLLDAVRASGRRVVRLGRQGRRAPARGPRRRGGADQSLSR
jgi:agmatinase